MKILLEYKVFDILKDKKNSDFLNLVKKENPELYSKFLNILGNKGLEIAKEKYKIYSTEYIKDEKLRLKRLKTKEGKEQLKKEVSIECASEINDMKEILLQSALFDIEIKFRTDKNISKYLKESFAKKTYKSNFTEIMKKPRTLRTKIKGDSTVHLDTLTYTIPGISDVDFFGWEEKGRIKLITIKQLYKARSKELFFDIHFNFPLNNIPKFEKTFIIYRRRYINSLDAYININIKRLFDKFSYALSNEFYEDWKFKKNVEKYNL